MMPELIPHAPDNPEFARVIELRQLRDLDAFDFDIAPDPREAEALARLLDARAVRKLRFARPPHAARRAAAGSSTAELGATVVQSCVVTLDPVTTRIDQPVRRTFLPETAARGPEIVVDPEEDDEIEPLADRIDLGLRGDRGAGAGAARLSAQAGRHLRAGETAPPDESEPKPFAALAALRGKIGDES